MVVTNGARTALPRITRFKVPRYELLRRDETQAFVSRLWLQGYQQGQIAEAFGYSGPAPITLAIREFCLRLAPDRVFRDAYGTRFPNGYGEDRRRIVELCLRRLSLKGGAYE
jgi:hypothetical protein